MRSARDYACVLLISIFGRSGTLVNVMKRGLGGWGGGVVCSGKRVWHCQVALQFSSAYLSILECTASVYSRWEVG